MLGQIKKTKAMGCRPCPNLKSKKSQMMETMLHFQLSVESPEKPLLKYHLAILLKPQRKTDNIKFSKRTEVGGGEKESNLFLFRAKFQPRI